MTDTVPELLRARVAEFGTKRFVVCDDDVLTYADADRRSAEVARGLLTAGLGTGSHVGILLPNGSDFVVATLAVARIGAVSLPFPTMSTAHELDGMARGADVTALLTAPAHRAVVPSLDHVWFGNPPAVEIDLAAVEAAVRPAHRLVIVHTSGSTSRPKAVVHTHGGLLRHLRNVNAVRRYDASETMFSTSPFFWIGGYAATLLATLDAGATLVCSTRRDAGELLDLLERERPTLVNGFARSVAHLAQHPSFTGRDLSSIRRGNLWPIMPDDVRPADPELRHNMLGMTETGSIVTLDPDEGDQPEHRRGSFGRPAPEFEARVRDPDTGTDRPAGEWGELHLRGPLMFEGYYGRERHETFDADGWYATGDVVRFDTDGYLYFRGRRSEMIKTSGANVSPREVEQAILAVSGLVAHVVGIDDAERGQVVAAAIVTADPLDAEDLRTRLAQRLSGFKVPRIVRTVPEAPTMSSGKLDLPALRELLG